jgi:NAD(P)-dependent dehydrogenase (short-subunit alcohol dehydrogenase family)
MDQMKNKMCVVTGAGNGIGKAVAECLYDEGASLVITDINEDGIDEWLANHPRVTFVQLDALKLGEYQKLADAVESTGKKIDALVSVVGGGPSTSIHSTDEKTFDLVMDLNVKSSFFTVQTLLPFMARESSIVLFSSIAGFQGGRDAIVYNAAKAAVRSLVRSLAAELSDDGIRANAVSPGPTDTTGFEDFIHGDDQTRGSIVSQIPVGHIGKPEEVAQAVLFLASPASSYVNGSSLVVDGGFTNN